MFVALIICTAFTIIIFFLSRFTVNAIFRLFYSITGKVHVSAIALTIILFPGTIIHELSHFLAATFTGVRTGEINLVPKLKDGGIIAGETQIAQCDPIRYTFIGIAPLIVGLLSIFFVFDRYILLGLPAKTGISSYFSAIAVFAQNNILISFFIVLFLFWLSNTMFSSSKDLEAMAVPLVLIYIIGFVIYFSGFRIEISESIYRGMQIIFSKLAYFLFFVILVDVVFLTIFSFLRSIVKK